MLFGSDNRALIFRYGFAVSATAAALGLQLAARNVLPTANYFLFMAAVMLSAIYGGFGPALASTALSTLAFAFFFGEPRYTVTMNARDAVQTGVFAFCALGLSWLVAAMRDRERRATMTRARQLESVANAAPVMIWASGPDKRSNFFNRGWLRFTGRAIGEEIATSWNERIHPDDLARWREAFDTAFAARRPFRVDYRMRREDGTYRWIWDEGVPRFDDHGEFEGYLDACVDVDALKSVELERERMAIEAAGERERLRNIVSSVPGVVWEAWGEPDRGAQRINFVSSHVEEMLGYTVEEWLSTPNFWLTIVHPDDRERAAANAAEHFARGGADVNEFRWMTKDGRALWVQSNSAVINDASGKPIGMRGVTIDATARKRAEDALRFLTRSSEVLSSSLDYETTLAEAARLATSHFADVCVIDVIGGGPRPDKMFIVHREPEKQAAADRLRQYNPRDNPTSIANEVIRTGRPALGSIDEAMMTRTNLDDTTRVHVRELGTRSYMVVPIQARGRTFGSMWFGSMTPDHYDNADLELAVLFARRAAIAIDNAQLYRTAIEASSAKDEFLATVSHELRTPMTATLGWTRMLLSGYLDPGMDRPAIEAIDRSTRAQSQLIDDILDVSSIVLGKFRLETAPVDLRSIVDAAVETVRPALAAKAITVDVDTSAWSGIVQGDAGRLQQVVWNLLSNAIKFGRRNGKIVVRLELIAGSARLSVSDDGIGIERTFLPFVFDRFRQADGGMTRTYGGLGLGLAIVKHLVELHGGSVSAASEGPGQGAVFTVDLPLAAEGGTTAQVGPQQDASRS